MNVKSVVLFIRPSTSDEKVYLYLHREDEILSLPKIEFDGTKSIEETTKELIKRYITLDEVSRIDVGNIYYLPEGSTTRELLLASVVPLRSENCITSYENLLVTSMSNINNIELDWEGGDKDILSTIISMFFQLLKKETNA